MSKPPRILILCTDRDDDIGNKTKIKTPVVGREACIQSGVKLALADPEEADANAIFASVKLYDELSEKGISCEIAVVAGDIRGGYTADEKIKAQVVKLKEKLGFKEIILVSDGIEDEAVLPVLQSVAPIASVHRITIKHSGTVEESYAVIAKYLKMLVYDPRYSKFVLGIPGLLLIIYGILFFTPWYHYLNYFLALILGIIFVVRGFGLDRSIQMAKRRPIFYVRIFAFLGSILITIVGGMQAYSLISTLPEYKVLLTHPEQAYSLLPYLSGVFIEQLQPLLWIAIGLNFAVGAIYHAAKRSMKFLRDVIILLALSLFYLPTYEMAQILKNPQRPAITIVSLLLLGLAVLMIIVYLAYYAYRQRKLAKAT